MEKTLIKAINLLDSAMDAACPPALIPPLSFLKDLSLIRWNARKTFPDCDGEALLRACEALPALSSSGDWPLGLPAALRGCLFALCRLPSGNAAKNSDISRKLCCFSVHMLRAAQRGRKILTSCLNMYSPDIVSEEKRMMQEQYRIMLAVYSRQLVLYRCAGRADALRLRERYTQEAEDTLYALPAAGKINAVLDVLDAAGETAEEKRKDFLFRTDNRQNTAFQYMTPI